MLNWRRDPGYEQRKMQHELGKTQHELRMNDNRIAIERSKERTKQLEKEILRVRSDREQIEKEIEQLDHENAIEGALSDSIRRLCFPPESSSIPQTSTAPDYKPS
jgi:chromosome segregation ATPase